MSFARPAGRRHRRGRGCGSRCSQLLQELRARPAAAGKALRPGATTDEAALIDHARVLLRPFKMPKRVPFLDALPKNTAGELRKRELRARFGSEV